PHTSPRGPLRSTGKAQTAARGRGSTLGRVEVGFIGVGKMDAAMTVRLLAAGHTVHVFNRSRRAVDALAKEGATPADSARQVAERAEIVMTALPTPDSVETVYAELARSARAGQTFVDHSTVSPGLNQRCAEQLKARGADFLDAPVSGGPAGLQPGGTRARDFQGSRADPRRGQESLRPAAPRRTGRAAVLGSPRPRPGRGGYGRSGQALRRASGPHHLAGERELMPRFAANLSMLWPELDVYERFRAAAEAGFSRVEILVVHV